MEIAIRSKRQQRAWHRGPSAPHVNPAEETIGLGPLTVRFFGSPEGIGCGSIAAFQVIVPGAQRLAAPAHSHDHYEARSTLCPDYGLNSEVEPRTLDHP